jgi:hypothetical protein
MQSGGRRVLFVWIPGTKSLISNLFVISNLPMLIGFHYYNYPTAHNSVRTRNSY